MKRRGRLPDPEWKSGPTHQEPTASEHAIHPEDFGVNGFDFDGFGVSEEEMVAGEPLVVIQEQAGCSRDGCDATHKRRLLFTTETLSEEERWRLQGRADIAENGELPAYVGANAERVDIDAIEVHDIRVDAEEVVEAEPTGQCYGRVEPEPNVDAHRYDEL